MAQPLQTDASSRRLWNSLPLLALIVATGTLIISIADAAARDRQTWANPAFWTGLAVIVLPVLWRLCGRTAGRSERLAAVILLGAAIYLVKVLHSPQLFTFHDEFMHWATTSRILETGDLLNDNPLNPTSARFPGAEALTAGLVVVGGLSIFHAGLIVVGAAKLVLALALFLLLERVTGSARAAGMGSALYAANPNFVFWSSQFSYESIALPLALFVLLCTIRAGDRVLWHHAWLAAALAGTGVVVVTHHLTSYALVVMLVVNAVALSVGRWEAPLHMRRCAWLVASFATVAAVGWFTFTASAVVDYVGPPVHNTITETLRLILGSEQPRRLFVSAGVPAPLWERTVALIAVALLVAALPFSLPIAWRRFRHGPLALTLILLAAVYPLSLLPRLTTGGQELSNRSSEFLFLGLSFVLAVGAVWHWTSRAGRLATRPITLTAILALVFAGGVVAGFSHTARLPGPYLVGSFPRSVDEANLRAVAWTRSTLGPANRIAATETPTLLLGSYGQQWPLATAREARVWPVFFGPEVGGRQLDAIRAGRISFVVVDTRLSTALPQDGYYVGKGEPFGGAHRVPIPLRSLKKFDRVPSVSRIYDGGPIRIYDVRQLRASP